MTRAYYNEIDQGAAEWLRELIRAGELPDGEVDERSIRDVCPVDLRGFTECHFFAGIGVWARALRDSGVDCSGLVVWTGSCPCQPFSSAGQRGGFDDERHLWPDWFWLIRQCRPDRVFGEQVASADGLAWLDLVCADMEGEGYAIGASDTCAAGFGAPHIRQRLYFAAGWLADADDARSQGRGALSERAGERAPGSGGLASRLAHPSVIGRQRGRSGKAGNEPGSVERPERLCDAVGMDDAASPRQPQKGCSKPGESESHQEGGSGVSGDRRRSGGMVNTDSAGWEPGKRNDTASRHGAPPAATGIFDRPGPVNGFWRDADWLRCRDGKWRPVEPGTFPLAHGTAGRVGLLRGYGNGLVLPQATAFVQEAFAAIGEQTP